MENETLDSDFDQELPPETEQVPTYPPQPKGRSVGCLISLVVGIAIIIGGGVGAFLLVKAGPKAKKEEHVEIYPVVRVLTVTAGNEQLYVQTQGQVEPRRRTQAAAEVAGRITLVSPKFTTGGIFKEGEIMIEVHKADYAAALARAQATLADAQLMLAQEEARAEQAMRDWAKLGKGKAPDLVARKPQITSAKARITSAEAERDRALRDLERTQVRAPYTCRVEATYTDLGSFITPGARLADLYSLEELELRLPVTLEDFAYLTESTKGNAHATAHARLGGELRSWKAEIVRSEGKVDRNTMMVHLVAKIKKDKNAGSFALPPTGLFMQASITGRLLEGVISIPRSALRGDNTVLLLGADDKLKIVPVKLARTLKKTVLVSSGLNSGDRVIISPLETPVEGMKLELSQEAEASAAQQ